MNIEWKDLQHRTWLRLPRPVRWPLQLTYGAAERWLEVSGPQLGASIAFYTMFALAPLLVIMIAIAGSVFGVDAARGQIVDEIENLVGNNAARAIQDMIASAWREQSGLRAALIGGATLLVGATGAFAELHHALNLIGKVTPAPSVICAFVRVRLTAFALLLGFGFLSIASLVISASLAAFARFITTRYELLGSLATLFDLSISVAVLSLAFAALVRWLPDEPPSRKGVLISAIASAVLFTIGKSLIGLYLGRMSVTSSYGAAGSFVVIMLWVYYSSQILLYGASLGRVYDEGERKKGCVDGSDRTRHRAALLTQTLDAAR